MPPNRTCHSYMTGICAAHRVPSCQISALIHPRQLLATGDGNTIKFMRRLHTHRPGGEKISAQLESVVDFELDRVPGEFHCLGRHDPMMTERRLCAALDAADAADLAAAADTGAENTQKMSMGLLFSPRVRSTQQRGHP